MLIIPLVFLAVILAGAIIALWNKFIGARRTRNCLTAILKIVISILVGGFLATTARVSEIVATPDLGYVRFGGFVYPWPKEFDTRNIGKPVVGESGFPFSAYIECSLDMHGSVLGTACEERSRYGEDSIPMNWIFWSAIILLFLCLESLLPRRLWATLRIGRNSEISWYLRRKIVFLSILFAASAIGLAVAALLAKNLAIVFVTAGYIFTGMFMVVPIELVIELLPKYRQDLYPVRQRSDEE